MPVPNFKVILSALIAMALSALVVFHLPLVPNWPYVGWLSFGASVALGGIYFVFVRPDVRARQPYSFPWLARVLPFYFFVYSCFWSFLFVLTESGRCREFSEGIVVEKFKSSNHGSLSVRVDLGRSGTVTCEGLSAETWETISPGSKIAKRCGPTDVVMLKP